MTETELYNRTRVGLVASVILPLVVGLSGLNGGNSVSDRLTSYVSGASKLQQVTVDPALAVNTTDNLAKEDPQSGPASKLERSVTKPVGSYVVKDGDTYGCIAERYYGSYDQWTRIYEANAGWPGFNEYDLAVGAKLQLPAVSADQVVSKTNLCE